MPFGKRRPGFERKPFNAEYFFEPLQNAQIRINPAARHHILGAVADVARGQPN